MTYHVVVTRSAKRDLMETVAWWGEHRSSEQAIRWYSKFVLCIDSLAGDPERCPSVLEPELLESGVRQLNFGVGRKTTHRILFTIVGKEVRVLRVRHVAQNVLGPDDLK